MSNKRKKQAEPAPPVPCVLSIEEESQRLLQVSEATREEMDSFFPDLLNQDIPAGEVQGKVDSLRRASANITRALTQTYALTDEFGARWKDIKKQKKKNPLLAAPANAQIDLTESRTDHFARGLNLYKLLLICFIGSFAGVVVELLWCLVTNGYIESRAGLVYGPFNLLYGAGAVALTLCLYYFRNRGSWISFLGGMLVGSVIEYICSWGQELLLGSRSWDYSHMPFNINGRICLLYSVFWGILGVLWIKNLYPRMARWILKIPNRVGKILTWALTIFFIFDTAVTGCALFRWSQRTKDVPADGSFWEMVDERFPDERMERIFANMEFSDSTGGAQ